MTPGYNDKKKRRNRRLVAGGIILFVGYCCLPSKAPTEHIGLPLRQQTIKPPSNKTLQTQIQPGDSLTTLLRKHHQDPALIPKLLSNKPYAKKLSHLTPKTHLTLTFDPKGKLVNLCLPLNLEKNVCFAREHDFNAREINRELTQKTEFKQLTIKHSLYLSGRMHGVSDNLLKQLQTIFQWQIDFERDIQPGDTVKLTYDSYYQGNKKIRDRTIILAEIHNRKRVLQAVRYIDHEDKIHYYTPQGHNVNKAFVRYPVNYSHISSLFNKNRMHPILKIKRPHHGIDFAAKLGTPVRATGDGKVVHIGKSSGYGNVIKLQHHKKYKTIYAHLHKFHPNMRKGRWVKQGDIIGYVGQTGLATAPHLHYEFRIHNIPKNPLTIALPRAPDLPVSKREAFRAYAQTRLAQLNHALNPQLTSEDQNIGRNEA